MNTIQLEIHNGIAQLIFDMKGEKVNKLSTPVMRELETHLKKLATRKNVKALVFQSAKDSIFIAGADIQEIADIKNPAEAREKAGMGQEIMNKIEDMPFPTFAFINGAAMGGGLELSLACDFRIAGIGAKTKLGLPETQLGIIPGFGGTYRLPRLVGLLSAAKMILSGKPVDAKKAAKMKLVDAAYPQEFLQDWGMRFVQQLVDKPQRVARLKKQRLAKKFAQSLSEDFFLGRSMVIKALRKNVTRKTGGMYPALYAALRVLKKAARATRARALEIELEEFGTLAASPTCKNLVALFFAQEKAKKLHRLPHNPSNKLPTPLGSAAVLGSGVMGGKIAWLFSKKGIPVVMKDIQWSAIQKGYAEAKSVYKTLVKIKKADARDVDLGMNKISGVLDYAAIGKPDVVVEAVVENLKIKKQVLSDLEAHVSTNTLIVSNTSALSIDELASGLKNPKRFCGMHFFNPAHRMPLVEIISGKHSSGATIAHAVHASRALGKTPVVVKNCPGFLVNRLLMPYLNEATALLEHGVNVAQIDSVLKSWGMPMGPLRLLDEIGIDVGYEVAHTLNESYGERMNTGALLLHLQEHNLKERNNEHASRALLGKKNGCGFYLYEKKSTRVNPRMIAMINKVSENETRVSREDIVNRPLFMMINEAARALEERIVQSAWELDLALIMGIGFPPFRGGLLTWADSLGAGVLHQNLERLQEAHGSRFEPAPLIARLAKTGSSFYKAYPGL